jgi:hypothetical protein
MDAEHGPYSMQQHAACSQQLLSSRHAASSPTTYRTAVWHLPGGAKPTDIPMLCRLLLLVATLLRGVSAKPSDHLDCTSCVAAGFGWSPTRNRCGGFSNKQCDFGGASAEQPASSAEHTAEPAGLAEGASAESYEEDDDEYEEYEEEGEYDEGDGDGRSEASSTRQRKPINWVNIFAPMVSVAITTAAMVFWNQGTARAAAAKKEENSKLCTLNIHKILFTQKTIADTFRDGRPISDMVNSLQDGTLRVPGVHLFSVHALPAN